MDKELLRIALAELGILARENGQYSIHDLRAALAANSIRWLKPDAAQLAEEYSTENSFFDCWPAELGIRKPTKDEFIRAALRYGKAVRVPHGQIPQKFDDYQRVPGDYFYSEESGEKVWEAKELPMPVVFVAGENRNYIELGGRHRVGRAWKEGMDIWVWEIPYPKSAESLGLKTSGSATIEQALHDWTGTEHDQMANYDRQNRTNELNDLLNEWLERQPSLVGKVYRGMGFSESRWTMSMYDHFEPGSIHTIPNKESYTRDRSRIGSYGSGEIKVLITLHSRSGVDISRYSKHPEELEVVLPKGYKYRVISRNPAPGGIFEVELQEL